MVASRQHIRVEHARLEAAPRARSATVVELAGRHEFHRPAFERHLTLEPRIDPLHWLVGFLIVGSFLGAVVALIWS